MFQLPIRLILGSGLGEGRGVTFVYELPNGSAGQYTVKFLNPDFLKVGFTDGPSVIVLEERRKGVFGGTVEYALVAVHINRQFQTLTQ